MIEKDFVTEGLKRTRIDEYLENELERAGYGGMEIQVTPLGTMVVVYAERPGMVIGRGGKTVRSITQNLKTNYELENPQVEVKEVEVPELNPKIMAHKIAAMLQRGMHFRRVAYSALRRIMGSGAQGVEVTISGKIRGSRSACAKFTDGYIKRCGEPSTKFVKEGFATVQLKPGVLGIFVRIMPPGLILPDKVDILQPKIKTSLEESMEAPAEIVEGSVEVLEEITEESAEEATEIPVEEPTKPKKPSPTKKQKTPKVKEKVVEVKEAAKEKASEVKEKVVEVKEAAEKKTEETKIETSKARKKASKKATEVEKTAKEKISAVEEKVVEVKEAAKEEVSNEKTKTSKDKKKKTLKSSDVEKKTSKTKKSSKKTAEVKEKVTEAKDDAEEKVSKSKNSKAKKAVEGKAAKTKVKPPEAKKRAKKSE